MTILDDAREGMDPDIRVQDDLFGHVNGRWLDSATIPDDRSSWGPFVMLADQAEEHVREIVEACAQGRIEGEEARKIGDLYASFMDEERVDELGYSPIVPLLEQVDAISDLASLAQFLGAFERRGGGGLFGSFVDTDDRDSDRYLVQVGQGGIGLPDESYYREDKHAEVREKYVAYLRRLLTLAERPDAEATAARVLALETRIAAGHWERAATRDVIKTYNLRTLAELEATVPSFDFTAWIAALGGDRATIAETIVRQPSFFEHLEVVLGEASIEDWKAFLTVRALRTAAAYLSGDFVETNFDFYGRTLSGTPELRARWKRGVALVQGALGEAVGREYVSRHFPPRSKELMDGLVANLLEAYRQSISGLDWMTEETKQRAYDKLDTFVPKIGYPEKWRDYSDLAISSDDLLGNVLASTAYETDRELRKIGAPVDRDEWFMLPQTVNAYYNPGTNEICFPAGILQKPFFDAEADPAENYGGIGAVIGHEIGHGFDDQGAQYDGHGNLNDWWTPADKAAFEVKSKALISQYDGYEPRDLPGEHVNGALTVGENIGDLGGLTIALKAYRIFLGEEPVPERDGLTGVQRLFLNWAYVWRTKRREELATTFLATDPHSPPEFRANIARNLEEFHEAFEVKPGDGLWLDEADRVRIW
ncbi:M13 family metallopeptidase [Nocardioides aurantiacus]|uniref:Endothelin-converting enzyme/putative endopeptidase n=1 Tax=Nocardioides aurantiacus TaxID=86796 RepID=A0A3N2CPL6_9ACTN|nr:M13-type metalloendopeptidase [Nocardioides aurantiacus]ROR89254.1 endothelin-converting enzyme/putative endopeptidase [Nocardioides aurantiacus]